MESILAKEEAKLIEDMSAYVTDYLEKQVHPEAPEDFKAMVATMLIDGFEAGAAWADNVGGRAEKNIILTQ